MAVSVTCRALRKNATTGRVYIAFTDKTVLEFESLAAVQRWVLELETPETAKRLFIRWLLLRDADGANPAAAVGKRLTLDLSLDNPLVVDQT